MKLKLVLISLFFLGCQHTQKSLTDTDTIHKIVQPEQADYVRNWDERKLATLSQYKITGTCGGFPRIDIKTAPGFCVAQLYNGEDTVFPRMTVELDPHHLLLVDMGGWGQYNGRLYLLTFTAGKFQKSTLLDKKMIPAGSTLLGAVDRPHALKKGPDGLYYLGAAAGIYRFNPQNILKTLETVIENIPALGLHPLKNFEFDEAGNIFVNVGSATNVCEKQGQHFAKNRHCPEAEDKLIGQAQIRKYFRQANGKYLPQFQIYAKGLRNSMGLLWHPTKKLLFQFENSRDSILKFDSKLNNTDLPHEEFNIISENGHYGWPYCYDNNLKNPEWNLDCSGYKAPKLLLPAHSSPLGVLLYNGKMFPAWYQNRVLVSLHGYEPRGHRLVAFLRDDNGLPTGKPLSVIYGWDAKELQQMGSPVAITQTFDGGVLITEDKNRKVLKLIYDAKLGDGKAIDEIPEVVQVSNTEKNKMAELKQKLENALKDPNSPVFVKIQNVMIDKYCAHCHTGADARGIELSYYDYEGNQKRILEKKKAQEILLRLKGGTEFAIMPPDGFSNVTEKNSIIELYEKWMIQNKLK